MVVFLCILIFIILTIAIVMTACIEMNIENITIDSHVQMQEILKILLQEKNILKKFNVLNYVSFKIKIKLVAFNKMPILVIKKNNYDFKEALIRQYKKEIRKTKKQIEKDKRKARKLSKKILRKIIIKQTELEMSIGTENAAFTAIVVAMFNIIISLILPYIADSEKADKYNYNVQPMYLDKNVFFLQFSGIIELKIVHIMKVICEKEEKIRNE